MKYDGTSRASIEVSQEGLRQQLKDGETLESIADSLFYSHHSTVDDSGNDPYTDYDLTIEAVSTTVRGWKPTTCSASSSPR